MQFAEGTSRAAQNTLVGDDDFSDSRSSSLDSALLQLSEAEIDIVRVEVTKQEYK